MLVNMLEAKTQLSKLVEAVLRGEEVIIANRGKPMVRLVKAEAQTSKRVWGGWEDLMTDAEIDRAFTPRLTPRSPLPSCATRTAAFCEWLSRLLDTR
jgi:prevent-host-death family protein